MAAEPFGKYLLLHKLATGGMGEVWLARQSGPAGFDRFVAVKRLLPNLAENNEFVQMFLDEARLVARLTHPNICQVYEFGAEAGMYYLAMEYMEGEPLSSLLERSVKEKKPLERALVAHILSQALDGLHFAHERKDDHGQPLGLIHRDISPSNLFVTYDGNVKLLDFGIAKAAHRLTQTVAGAIKGKFGYIAPEVYRGEAIDRRLDVFAMGVVLWEMLVRKRLYKRETEYEVMRAIVEEKPPDPRQYDPTVPEGLALVALKALAKKPADRYQTANEMRKAVGAWLRTLPKEVDSDSVAGLMREVYGQVWIDMRATMLETFKEASGDISGADVLNPRTPSSSRSGVASFSRAVNPPPAPAAVPAAPAPAAPPRRTVAIAVGASLGVLLPAAGFAGYLALRPEPAPLPPPEPPPAPVVVAPPPPVPVPAPAPKPAAPPAPPPDLPGTLVVHAQPEKATVSLDGQAPVPAAAATFGNLAKGSKHHVVISAAGFEPKVYDFEVHLSGEAIDYEVALLPHHRPKPVAAKPKATAPVINADGTLNPWGN